MSTKEKMKITKEKLNILIGEHFLKRNKKLFDILHDNLANGAENIIQITPKSITITSFDEDYQEQYDKMRISENEALYTKKYHPDAYQSKGIHLSTEDNHNYIYFEDQLGDEQQYQWLMSSFRTDEFIGEDLLAKGYPAVKKWVDKLFDKLQESYLIELQDKIMPEVLEKIKIDLAKTKGIKIYKKEMC
ncbi:MAG: hypothetical protein FWE47_00555 [Oscillospiraceae bacterium]|nr:hypothetical protein [Oscillospiraceae bacterium]